MARSVQRDLTMRANAWTRIVVAAVVVSVLGVVSPGGAESPRATDLLRAQRAADRAKQLLTLPRPRGAEWVQGGSGWDARGPEGDEPAQPSVTINVKPPRGGSAGR